MINGKVGLILPHPLGKLCLLLRLMKGYQNHAPLVEKWVAFTSTNFVTGIKRSNLFDEVYSYDEHHNLGHFDYLIDLTSYDYSYELALHLNWGALINRQLDKHWLINKKLKGMEGTVICCPATEPENGWFSTNQDHPAMLCEIPLLNLSINFPIDSMELLQADISITLSDQQFSNDQNTVLLLICGANLAKHWPLDYWKIINDQLINSSFETLAIIGPNEKWLIPEIERLKIPFKEVNLLDDLFDFIQGACGVISNDCGPMHVSLMLNKPTLAIFGPTNPNSWFLRTNQHQACAQTNYSYMNRSQAPLLKPWPSWPQPSEIYDKFIKLIDANLIKT